MTTNRDGWLRAHVLKEQEVIHIGVSAFLAGRGLSRYEASLAENGITEELLPALTHDERMARGIWDPIGLRVLSKRDVLSVEA